MLLSAPLLIVACALAALIDSQLRQELSVVNGLAQPVTVDFDGVKVRVDGGGRAQVTLSTGSHNPRVECDSGAVVEDGAIVVPPRTQAVVYNVLGAAPLYRQSLIYSAPQGNSPPPTEPLLYAGLRLFAADNIVVNVKSQTSPPLL